MTPDTEENGGGETLSLDEAAAAYAKATSNEADTSQSEDEIEDSGTTDDELQASDEDEGEEADGEAEPEGQDDDEDGEEPETERGRYVAHNGRVKLSDGTESTVADLIAGNLKDRDYRQKTMELAELRRSTEAQSAASKASEQRLEQERAYMAALLQSIVPQAPDLSLLDQDPQAYFRQEALHKQWSAHLNHIEQQQRASDEERKAKAAGDEKGLLEKEWQALLTKVPEFKDQKQVDRFASEIKEHAPAYGITPEEFGIFARDHRYSLVMRDAIAMRKLRAAKKDVPKKVEGRPPVTKGGKRLTPNEHRARAAGDAMNRLQSSGRVDDAVRAYIALQKG